MKRAIYGACLALALAGAFYVHGKTNFCIAHQWDRQDRFYCTRGPDFAVSNVIRHTWANDVVWAYADNHGMPGGSYDTCTELAVKLPVKPNNYDNYFVDESGLVAMNIPLEMPQELQDACALVLHGAEF